MPKYYQGTLYNMIRKLKDFEPYVNEYLSDYLASDEANELITRAVANNQLYARGINGRGEKIMDYAPYAQSTIRRKIRKGQPHTRVTLRDTGAFHAAFRVVTTPKGFYITSDDYKTQWLVNKYGESIFRLTDENFARILNVHIRKGLAKYIKRKYNVK